MAVFGEVDCACGWGRGVGGGVWGGVVMACWWLWWGGCGMGSEGSAGVVFGFYSRVMEVVAFAARGLGFVGKAVVEEDAVCW